MSSEILRRPPGIPEGGEFAGHRRLGSGFVLTDDDDPWLDEEDPWAGASDEPGTQMRDQLRARADELARAVAAPPTIPPDLPEEQWHDWAGERLVPRDQARKAAIDEHGSVEQAVTALGAQIATRGEEIAGITGEEIRQRWTARTDEAEAEYNRTQDEYAKARERYMRDNLDDLSILAEPTDAANAAANRYHLVRSGQDDETKAEMRRLADGYQQALSEVRELGGQAVWHERSDKRATKAFDEASELFPADWIEASNARVGGQREIETILGARTVEDQAPVAKLTKVRAHYVDVEAHTKKKRVEDARNLLMHKDAVRRYEDLETGEDLSPHVGLEPVWDQEELARLRQHEGQDETPVRWVSYEVRPIAPWEHGSEREPKGPGWQMWTDPRNPERRAWRRKKHRYENVETFAAPEITASARQAGVAGRSEHFTVAAHEMSHRFEYSVPEIAHLESDFLRRRTTDPATGERERPVVLYASRRGKRELAFADQFTVAYTGRAYHVEEGRDADDQAEAYEVLSTGVEGVFAGRHGGLAGIGRNAGYSSSSGNPTYDPDPDLRDFVLGVMAVAGRRS